MERIAQNKALEVFGDGMQTRDFVAVQDVIYSIHKIESERFIKKFSRDNGFELAELKTLNMRLRKTQDYHKMDFYRVKVGCFLIRKLFK